MARSVSTHLMFEGVAEEAMNFYVSLFRGSEIIKVERYGAGEHGAKGTLRVATFTLCGREFMCIDSPIKHEFTFTPSISIFVECESDAEIEDVFGRLSAGGQVLMPLDNYWFSTKFGWVKDRFGPSWQLNLAVVHQAAARETPHQAATKPMKSRPAKVATATDKTAF